MKIKWLGHSAFLITSDAGVRAITDPYEPGAFRGGLSYGPITEKADIYTVSHLHADHYDPGIVASGAVVLKNPGKQVVRGIEIEGVLTCHDDTGGRQRGLNTVFCITMDGLRICHLGDLGHLLSDKELKALGRVDVLMIPVGGHFTIDAAQATEIAEALKPKLILPMHYKPQAPSPKPQANGASFPITGVDEFLKGKKNVRRLDQSEVEISRNALPRETEVWVMKHAN